MGIADRSYARRPPPGAQPPLLRRLRLLSVNMWIIVICVVVWVLAATVFQTVLRQPLPMTPQFAQGVTAEQIRNAAVRGSFDPRAQAQQLEIVDQRDRQTLGYQIVYSVDAPQALGHFSTARGFFGLEVWRLITFQFLHANFIHLVMNMVGLWFFGPIVEQYLGSKKYLAFYLTCGIFGALFYLLLNLLGFLMPGARVPGLLFVDIRTPLVGASAGIFGVIMAAAFINPREIIYVFGIAPAQLRTIAYGFVAISLVSLLFGTLNAGGEAAHVGGAVAGYFFVRRNYLLRDFFDVFDDSRRPPTRGGGGGGGRRGSNPRLRLVSDVDAPSFDQPPAPDPAEVDRILAKLHADGVASLTDAEKAVLAADTKAKNRG